METRTGRPLKYETVFEQLEPDKVYCAATISRLAIFFGIGPECQDEIEMERRRLRSSCGYISRIYNFPLEGDGLVFLKGQRPTPGWFGWRWSEAIHQNRKIRRNKSARSKRMKERTLREKAELKRRKASKKILRETYRRVRAARLLRRRGLQKKGGGTDE